MKYYKKPFVSKYRHKVIDVQVLIELKSIFNRYAIILNASRVIYKVGASTLRLGDVSQFQTAIAV